MISEEEKQKMIAFLRNPKPIELHFEKMDVPPELIWAFGSDGQFHTDDEDEYGNDEIDLDDDEIAVWPERIVKSGRATIVFWEDGTKTVVKRSPDEPDNDYNAFLAALGIKIFGSNSRLKKIIKEQMVVQKPKKWKDVYDKAPVEKKTDEEIRDAVDRFWDEYDNLKKVPIEKDACPIDKPCEKSTVEHDLDALNEQAKKQYEEYLAADKWTCPQCGRKYHWQKNDEGRYAFCPKCQLASKDRKA